MLKKKLKGTKVKKFVTTEAKNLMDNSDPIPAILSNSGVYQTARQDAIDESLQMENYPGSTLESLHLMSDKLSSIKMISTEPFIVMYWTTQQIKLWKEAMDPNDVEVSIDASGSFVKRVNIIDDNFSSDIFLYVIIIRFARKVFPVCQMLSASHNTNTISDFLMRSKENNAPTPRIVVLDGSLALLNAASLAYNDCSYSVYLGNCFKILQEASCISKKFMLPSCLIMRDRNHLIKNVTQWKCFKGKDPRIKDFYTRCIAYSLEVDSLSLLEEVLSNIFIVCQSETCDETTECYKSKKWFLNKIETFTYNEIFNETDEINEDNSIQIIETEKSEGMSELISNYLNTLNSNCQLKCSRDTTIDFPNPNFFQCKALVDNLMMLFSQFPAWTNVMRRYYSSKKSSTSTGSELYFRILKNEYNMSHPVSANRFILNHLKLIDGETKLGNAAVKRAKITPKNDETTKLGNAAVKRAKITPKNDKTRKQEFSRTIIINGLKLPPVLINNKKYQLLKTCPFDSILEIIISSYEHEKFQFAVNEYLNSNRNDFLTLVKKYIDSEFNLEQVYNERAKMMLSLVERAKIMLSSVGSGNYVIDCEMNVTALFERLMKSFSDITGRLFCGNCGNRQTLHYQTKVLNNFTFNHSDEFTSFVISAFSKEPRNCRKCVNSDATLIYELGLYIALDVEFIFEKAFENRATIPTNNIIRGVQQLPLYLHLHKKQYCLAGVVGFIPVEERKGSHYTAYIRKPLFWEVRNDLNSDLQHIPLSKLEIYIALIIYIQAS